jgi:hypothetical protein
LTLFLQFADNFSVNRLQIALIVLALAGIISVVGPLLEARQRAPEAAARAYLLAVEAGDLDAALATIDPAQRETQRERVELQVRNRYGIVTLVLGRPSTVDGLTVRATDPAWVTVLADVTSVTGDRWRSTSTAPLVQRDGVWYLTRPLFA